MWKKSVVIILGALLVTTLGIEASDVVQGRAGRLTGTVLLGDSSGPCRSGETVVRFGEYALCVDTYEASPSESCLYPEVTNEVQSNDNVYTTGCRVVTESGRVPWRYVSYTQAQQLCAHEGKRLLTAKEWYRLAVGVVDTGTCILTTGSVRPTGAGCVAPNGVYDLVGNLWEWVDDTVMDGQWQGRYLPQSGYVSAVTADGVVTDTSDVPVAAFGEDFATVAHEGERGMIRGGFYDSGSDGGLFAQNMSVPLSIAAPGIGFRCVRDVE